MAVLIFRLRNVPEDEADDVREILEANGLEYYETSAGNWGISLPGIWLKNDRDRDEAKQLIESYERQRSETLRAQYEQLKREGKQRTLLDAFKENPLRFILYLAIVVLVLYVSTLPFLTLGE